MLHDKVTVKQVPDASAEMVGLHKHKRSKMPSTRESLVASLGLDGRYITGIDEYSMAIESITDDKEKAKVKKETKTLRERLEKLTGKDLSGTSTFWEEYYVNVSADQDLVLVRSNPHHVISYHVLIENGYAAPSLDETGLPKYHRAKYYMHSASVERKESVTTRKKRSKAESKLLEISNNKDLMLLIGQFLEGPKYTTRHEEDDLYTMLYEFIYREEENTDKFVKAASKGVEELQFKVVLDKAIRNKIIKWDKKYYQRGQVTLGKNIEEVFDNLRSPEFAAEFLSIKKELEEIKK